MTRGERATAKLLDVRTSALLMGCLAAILPMSSAADVLYLACQINPTSAADFDLEQYNDYSETMAFDLENEVDAQGNRIHISETAILQYQARLIDDSIILAIVTRVDRFTGQFWLRLRASS